MFLIVWRGLGILVPLISVVAVIGCTIMFAGMHLPLGPNPEAGGALGEVIGGGIAGAALFFIARSIESKPGRVLIDAVTNQRIVFKKSAGSFFFIPTRYWAFITPGLALLLAVAALTAPPKSHLLTPSPVAAPASAPVTTAPATTTT